MISAETAASAYLWAEAKAFIQTSSPFRQTLSINVTAIPGGPVYLQKLCHILAGASSVKSIMEDNHLDFSEQFTIQLMTDLLFPYWPPSSSVCVCCTTLNQETVYMPGSFHSHNRKPWPQARHCHDDN